MSAKLRRFSHIWGSFCRARAPFVGCNWKYNNLSLFWLIDVRLMDQLYCARRRVAFGGKSFDGWSAVLIKITQKNLREGHSSSISRSSRWWCSLLYSHLISRSLEIKRAYTTTPGSNWILIEWWMWLPVSNDSQAFYVFSSGGGGGGERKL